MLKISNTQNIYNTNLYKLLRIILSRVIVVARDHDPSPIPGFLLVVLRQTASVPPLQLYSAVVFSQHHSERAREREGRGGANTKGDDSAQDTWRHVPPFPSSFSRLRLGPTNGLSGSYWAHVGPIFLSPCRHLGLSSPSPSESHSVTVVLSSPCWSQGRIRLAEPIPHSAGTFRRRRFRGYHLFGWSSAVAVEGRREMEPVLRRRPPLHKGDQTRQPPSDGLARQIAPPRLTISWSGHVSAYSQLPKYPKPQQI